MNSFFSLIFFYGTAAVIAPVLVFFVVVWLVVRKSIGFGVMVTLLTFGLVAGFAIANYDIVRNNKADGIYSESIHELHDCCDELKEELKALSTQAERLLTRLEEREASSENLPAIPNTSDESDVSLPDNTLIP